EDHGAPDPRLAERIENARELQLPAAAAEAEMDADDGERPGRRSRAHHHAAPRLDPGQVDQRDRLDLQIAADENGVAVPAEAHGRARQLHGPKPGLARYRGARDGAVPWPEALVRRLQRDDVGI